MKLGTELGRETMKFLNIINKIINTIGVLFLLVVCLFVGGILYYLFWPSTPRQPDPVYSPSGKRVIAPTVNMSKEDMKKYLCLYIEVKETDTGNVLFAHQTDASVRMRYSFHWISDDFIKMQSSDIGDYCWREGSGGVWESAACSYEPSPTLDTP
ncbi:MAG TPA: hypothetical protein VEA58_08725 [Anaerovoracaceae bacterium]|nr:hypothetical protein [Anaerovoracaceae bacterium]